MAVEAAVVDLEAAAALEMLEALEALAQRPHLALVAGTLLPH